MVLAVFERIGLIFGKTIMISSVAAMEECRGVGLPGFHQRFPDEDRKDLFISLSKKTDYKKGGIPIRRLEYPSIHLILK